jgi:hypothetical protein
MEERSLIGECPVCHNSWRSEELPPSLVQKYGTEVEELSLLVGFISPETNKIAYYMCPFCNTFFDSSTWEELELTDE